MKRISALAALAALVAAFAASSATGSHSWGGYHWARTSNPFTIKLGDNLTASWKTHLQQASSDWSKSTVLDTVVVAGQAKGKCRPTAGRVEVCNDTYGQNGWLGLAQIWLSGTHITQGTVKVNDTYFNTAKYNDPTKKQHVMCQEVGHTFGLDHQDESGADLNTCMDYSNALDNPSPNAHDYEQLDAIYAHSDSSSTIGASVGMAGSNPSPVAVSRTDGTRASTIVERFGDGTSRVTFIFWTF